MACALSVWLRLVSDFALSFGFGLFPILLFFVAVRLSEQAGGAVVEAVGSFSAPLSLSVGLFVLVDDCR